MRKIYILLFLFLSVINLYSNEIKTECSSEKEIKKRVHIKTDNLNLCAISLKTEDKDYYNASFTTPWFGFGKLKSRGLLTESLNPCGYSPTSEVFFQDSDLILDTSITDSGKYGMYVKPGEYLMFYSYGDKEDWYIRGIKSDISIGDIAISMIIENSDVEERNSEIFNAFLNLIYENDWFMFSGCSGCSFGDYTENGIFNREYISFFYKKLFEFNLMFSGMTENYLRPGGVVPSSQYKYGIDTWVRPIKQIKLSFLYYNDYKMPDIKDDFYNDFIQHMNTQLTLYFWDLRLTGEYTWEKNFKNTSERERKEELEIGIRYDREPFCLMLSNVYYIKDYYHYRDVWKATARFDFDPIELSFTYKRDIQEEITNTFKEEIMLRSYPICLKFTHKKDGDKESEFIFSGTINY